MKTWLYSLFICFFSLYGYSQSAIEGKVWDGKENLPGASVLLLGKDSTVLKGTFTDADGKFLLEGISHGEFMISAQFIGYGKYVSGIIALSSQKILSLDILLYESSTQLKAVEVSGQRQQYEQRNGQLVIHIQNSITS